MTQIAHIIKQIYSNKQDKVREVPFLLPLLLYPHPHTDNDDKNDYGANSHQIHQYYGNTDVNHIFNENLLYLYNIQECDSVFDGGMVPALPWQILTRLFSGQKPNLNIQSEMKKVLFRLLNLGCVALAAVGCATMAQTYGSVPIAYPEMSADLDVNTASKLVATNSTTYLFGFLKISGGNKYAEMPTESGSLFGRPGNLSRAAATYKAIEGYDYDVVAAPNYRTTQTIGFLHLWVTYKTTMTGYGAKIKSLKLADGQEASAADVEYTSTSEDIQIAKDAKKSGTQQTANPIFSTKNLELFEGGLIASAAKKDQKELESSFVDEIKSNLGKAKTVEEYEFIQRKVNALKAYNDSLESPKKALKSTIEDYEKSIDQALARLKGGRKSILGGFLKK